mgnify:CR=1 FL=1
MAQWGWVAMNRPGIPLPVDGDAVYKDIGAPPGAGTRRPWAMAAAHIAQPRDGRHQFKSIRGLVIDTCPVPIVTVLPPTSTTTESVPTDTVTAPNVMTC